LIERKYQSKKERLRNYKQEELIEIKETEQRIAENWGVNFRERFKQQAAELAENEFEEKSKDD